MRHNDGTDQTRGYAPRSLMRISKLVVFGGKLNIECLCKAIPKVVGSTCLQCLSIVHQCFNGIGCNSAGKLIAFGFSALYHRHSQGLLTEGGIGVQHTLGFFECLLCGCMNGVTFLPQEFSGTQERTRGLFPAHHANPLVIQLRQIPVAVYDVGIVLTEQCFRSRTHTEPFFQLFASAVGDPCHFRCKAFYVILFLFEQAFRNKHRHADIFMSGFLKHAVQNMLHILPDGVTIRTNDHTALDAGVFDKLCFFYNIGIPLCEILIHGGDFSHLFFVAFCHIAPPQY